MTESELVRVRDVMKVDFDVVDGLATVADAPVSYTHLRAHETSSAISYALLCV